MEAEDQTLGSLLSSGGGDLRFRALADTSVPDQLERYFMIYDQDVTNQ